MKYKKGDIVRIKTWEEMEKEYGLTINGDINCKRPRFVISMEFVFEKFFDRLIEISEINEISNHYQVKNMDWEWTDEMIEGLASETKQDKIEPILNRFEILDIIEENKMSKKKTTTKKRIKEDEQLEKENKELEKWIENDYKVEGEE